MPMQQSSEGIHNSQWSSVHLSDSIFNQVFNENLVIVMLKSAAGGRAGVNFWFPLNNFSLL